MLISSESWHLLLSSLAAGDFGDDITKAASALLNIFTVSATMGEKFL